MSFGEFLTAPQVWPFTLALVLFAVITVIEIVLVATGLGGSEGLDLSLDVDLPGVGEAAEAAQAAGEAAQTTTGWLLDWLGIGRVPYLISVAGFLLCFGIVGLVVQDIQLELVEHALPWPITAVGVAFVCLPLIRVLNRGLGRIWPKDVETSAVSQDSLIGHEAEIILGTATTESPAQIKLRDPQGTTHHLLALCDVAGEELPTGERVLLVGRRGATFLVIRHPNPSGSSRA